MQSATAFNLQNNYILNSTVVGMIPKLGQVQLVVHDSIIEAIHVKIDSFALVILDV